MVLVVTVLGQRQQVEVANWARYTASCAMASRMLIPPVPRSGWKLTVIRSERSSGSPLQRESTCEMARSAHTLGSLTPLNLLAQRQDRCSLPRRVDRLHAGNGTLPGRRFLQSELSSRPQSGAVGDPQMCRQPWSASCPAACRAATMPKTRTCPMVAPAPG